MFGIAKLFLLSYILHIVTASYIHVPSFIELKPLEPVQGINTPTDFGFSIAYQKGINPNLVIGSPHGDLNGQIFNCTIENILRNDTSCKKLDIDIEKYATDTNRSELINVEQNFCLGASIAPTSDYIFTCAPLWTATFKYSKKRNGLKGGPYGICFKYDGIKATRYTGYIENRKKNGYSSFDDLEKAIGGHGWSTLVDETNGYILISKPAGNNILYVSVSEPTSKVNFMLDKSKNRRDNYDVISDDCNIGTALAKGQFFSDRIDIMYYAFSLQDKYGIGKVGFAKMVPEKKLLAIEASESSMVAVIEPSVGSQFGASLLGADINADGVSDLLVGAPAYADTELSLADVGALYIYLGGKMDGINNDERRLEILASKDGGRFGTALAASDIDGDNLPEIFVSAPYEDSGVGALYILSGYDVNRTISSYKVSLLDIMSQRIQPEGYRSYGFSLQTVDDFDQNGCDELAVGAPGSGRVVLYRCLPAMNVVISTNLVEKNVKENDDQFNVNVCIDVLFPSKVNTIKTKLKVATSIIGNGAYLTEPHYEINLARKQTNYCNIVKVQLKNKETGDYKFTAEVTSNEDTFLESKDFDNTWVVLNPRSKTKRSLNVPRYCDDKDNCTPELEMSLFWNGNTIDHSKSILSYDLGSTSKEKILVLVKNTGTATYDGCVRLSFQNAMIVNISCGLDDNNYLCYLPRPLQRNDVYPIHVMLDMTKYTNKDDKTRLSVSASLFDNCNHQTSSVKSSQLDVELNLDTRVMEVHGLPNNITVTDVEVLNTKSKVINYEHEYKIINKGLIKWESVNVTLRIYQRTFITKYGVYKNSASGKMHCMRNDSLNMTEFTCTVDLLPNSTTKIFAVMDISKKNIVSNLETSSEFSIIFLPTSATIVKKISSEIKYIKEITLGNKKWVIILIAVIVAVLILTAIVFVLYKVGFFKRKQKERLESFRKSVKQRNDLKSTTDCVAAKEECDDDDIDDIDMEVVDDCPFEDPVVPTTTKDNVNLIVDTNDKKDKSE